MVTLHIPLALLASAALFALAVLVDIERRPQLGMVLILPCVGLLIVGAFQAVT